MMVGRCLARIENWGRKDLVRKDLLVEHLEQEVGQLILFGG